MSNTYDDIIHLPRPVSATHKPMSMEERAAQFAPFQALKSDGSDPFDPSAPSDLSDLSDTSDSSLLAFSVPS